MDLSFLKGKRSYIVAALTIVYAASGYLTGNIDFNTAVLTILGGSGLAALRASNPKPGSVQ
jgi:hypothetical protein